MLTFVIAIVVLRLRIEFQQTAKVLQNKAVMLSESSVFTQFVSI